MPAAAAAGAGGAPTLGFNLNFKPSPASADGGDAKGVSTLSTAKGAGTAAGSGATGADGGSIAGGVSNVNVGTDSGTPTGAAAATGASIRGFSRTRVAAVEAAPSPSTTSAIAGAAGAIIISVGADSGETAAGGGADSTRAAGASSATGAAGGGGAAAAGAAGESGSFSLGFRRNAGGGIDGSSLMLASKATFRRGAKTKSFPRRLPPTPPRSPLRSLMIPRLSLTSLALAALLTTGCLFSKKSNEPKENPAIAGSVEENFKVRWIDKRAADLTAQGKSADAARTQAADEFGQRYLFNAPPQKK